jgi:hypothetical protein
MCVCAVCIPEKSERSFVGVRTGVSTEIVAGVRTGVKDIFCIFVGVVAFEEVVDEGPRYNGGGLAKRLSFSTRF